MRSHQTRMTRIARMIYMLSQCKDAKDNPAALFARMKWRELSVFFARFAHLLCSEFLARMKRVNSKCSSVQLRANSAIYSRHSRLVWTHLYRQAWCLEKVVCVTWKALLAANTSVLKWLNQINTCYIWRDNVALSRGLWRTEASSKITHCKLLKIPAEELERERGRNKRLFWPFSCNLVMRAVFIFAGIVI